MAFGRLNSAFNKMHIDNIVNRARRLLQQTNRQPRAQEKARRFGIVALAVSALISMSVGAETKPADNTSADQLQRIGLELNKLEPQAGGQCRVYLVISNQTPFAFEVLQLDFVTFDSDGLVGQRLVVETAPLPAGKTGLRLFDVPATDCAGVSRILLNAVPACSAAGDGAPANPAACLALIDPSSKSDVELKQ